MNNRNPALGPGAVLLLALLAGGWFLQRGVAQDQNVYVQSRLFQEVLDHVADRYVDRLERDRLYEFAIDGLLGELNDPNTSLLNTEAYENFRIQTEGDYGGVGLEITERDGYVTVIGPIPGTPGARAGIRAGDRIVEVDGRDIRGWSSQQAVEILRGRPGAPVTIQVERPMVDGSMEFTLERARIQLRSVPFATLLEDGVGYIPLGVFNEGATREVQAAADALVAEGARALVLDLRGNPGGILDQGIGVADLFLPRRAPVVETRGQAREQNQRILTQGEDRYEGVPLVVLVNRGSASASEIVAGALQDHDRAVVVGGTTFGKGSVQTLFSLTGGNVLKLTTARWYTPAGRSIERVVAVGSEGGEAEPQPTRPPALAVDGQFVFPADTAGRPVVTSVGGRPLYAGGGIVPDLLAASDSLTTDEQRAVRTLFLEGGRFTVGVFNHAVAVLGGAALGEGPPESRGDIPVEEVIRLGQVEMEGLYQALRSEGLQAGRETWEGARRFVLHELTAEIALQGWGEEGRFLVRAPSDRALQEALALLRGVDSTETLLERAGARRGTLAARSDAP